jgi:hypothetical protein
MVRAERVLLGEMEIDREEEEELEYSMKWMR